MAVMAVDTWATRQQRTVVLKAHNLVDDVMSREAQQNTWMMVLRPTLTARLEFL